MLVAGVVSGSMNGDYKGNPIVKLKSNGTLVDTGEVPAMIYDGRTMVPIAALRNLGAEVTWDPKTYSVDVKLDSSPDDIVISKKMIKELQTKVVNLGGTSFSYSYAGGSDGFIELNFHGKSIESDIKQISEISKLFLQTDAAIVIVNYFANNIQIETVYIDREEIENYNSGSINLNEFTNSWIITSNESTTSQSTKQTNITNDGLSLYSNDGKTFLGKLTSDTFDAESIFNEFGNYGNEFSTTSIFNEFGTYGGEFSNESPFNPFATKPPIIVSNGEIIGYLTVNSSINNALSPLGLLKFLEDNGY